MIYTVGHVEDLALIRQQREWEREANMLLYGNPDILEDACEQQVFSARLYIPRNLTEPLIYTPPKYRRMGLRCARCGRRRSDGTAAHCSFCWRLQARLKYFDKREWLAYWNSTMSGGWENGEQVGITMPVTEWWDDRDIPAVPRRIALVDWK